MEKSFTLIQTIATAGVFSAISFWYGFMFGRESSRKELGDLIEDLGRGNPPAIQLLILERLFVFLFTLILGVSCFQCLLNTLRIDLLKSFYKSASC